jgi:hyaluronan synthase
VDSDTIWADDVAKQVCMPFADPRVGGVSTRQNVYNPAGFLQRVNDMYLDYRYFDENAAQTVAGRAISCLSGRTAVYRRHLLLEVADDFMSEQFLGVPCMSGDDKCLTSQLLKRGHQTVLQRTARVWSTFPGQPRTFFRQRLRWSRNTWRSDIRALFIDRWAWRHPFLAYTMLDKAVGSFTLLAAPTFMTLAIVRQDWFFVGLLAFWWWLSRAVKMLPHLRRRPSSLFLIPPFVLLSFGMAVIRIIGLCTIRKQRWLTRQVAVVDGAVVRTGEAALENA